MRGVGIHGKMTLKMTVKKLVVWVWNELAHCPIVYIVNIVMNFRVQ
jgi:hypothetical protein